MESMRLAKKLMVARVQMVLILLPLLKSTMQEMTALEAS
jgi:hypothetical protein